uniref:Uncharacterized protein n=1 Tax=Lutzomyia longipalpis TaxID=7200 RepID=A0A7G3B8A6_LUTLO
MASVKLTQITGRTRRASSELIWLAILLLLIGAGAAFYWLLEVSLLITFIILLLAFFYFNEHQSRGSRSPRSRTVIRNSFWDKLIDVAFGMVLLVFICIIFGSNSEITQEFVNGPSEEL